MPQPPAPNAAAGSWAAASRKRDSIMFSGAQAARPPARRAPPPVRSCAAIGRWSAL